MNLERKYAKADEYLLRDLVPAQEDRPLFTSAPWRGGYCWYRSSKVVCLEQYRRSRTRVRSRPASEAT
jgi:hypothetical protein